jgi:hypothetical protein
MAECYIGPLSWLPPFGASFLRDNNGVYAGTTVTQEHGSCDLWRVFLPQLGNFVMTVYFEQVYGRFVRYDFQTWGGDQGNVGVTTLLFNIVTGLSLKDIFFCIHETAATGDKTLIPQSVFQTPDACPNATKMQAPMFFHL